MNDVSTLSQPENRLVSPSQSKIFCIRFSLTNWCLVYNDVLTEFKKTALDAL